MEELAMPCRNKNEGNFCSMRFLSYRQKSEVFIAMSENKFNENNVVANDPNCLASVVTQEIYTYNKAGVLCMCEQLSFSNTSFVSFYHYRLESLCKTTELDRFIFTDP